MKGWSQQDAIPRSRSRTGSPAIPPPSRRECRCQSGCRANDPHDPANQRYSPCRPPPSREVSRGGNRSVGHPLPGRPRRAEKLPRNGASYGKRDRRRPQSPRTAHAHPIGGDTRTLHGLVRSIGRPQHQTEALTLVKLEAIRSTATLPRRGCGGALEGPATAKERGLVDIALCGLLPDGGLRRSEIMALTWRDIERWPDGSGRVTVRRSKTDIVGEDAAVAITRRTLEDLEAIRNGAGNGGRYTRGESAEEVLRHL